MPGPVAVSRPSSREKKDPLTQILRGLQVAQSVFGIKSAFEQSELRDIQKTIALEKRQREQTGAVTQEQFGQKYTKEAPSGVAVQPTTVQVQRPGGLEEETDVYSKAAIKEKITESAAKASAEADKQESKWDKADKIRQEYNKISNNTFESLRGYQKVKAAANNPNPTGATDVALVFGFMKSIDPESVVREGEFATAEKTKGVPDYVRTTYNKALDGQRLSPQQRQNFLMEAKRSVASQLEIQDMTDERYSGIAEVQGLDREIIINPAFTDFKEKLEKELGIGLGSGISSTGLPGETPAKAAESDEQFLQRFLQDPTAQPQGLVPNQPPQFGR